MKIEPVLSVKLPDIKPFKKGKVRDIYRLGDDLLIVATDRISAFDVIMPNGIPGKGKLLTALSCFWFKFTENIIHNHLITSNFKEIASRDRRLEEYREVLEGRSILVKKTEPLSIECVVRGYLAGSGWSEYKEKGSICGIKLPQGLKECGKLPEAIFTPATKAVSGHDENITSEEAQKLIGEARFNFSKEKSLEIYAKASRYVEEKGIIISDTKFEFGVLNDEIILIDEVLTSDSSRFWPKDEYTPGRPQKSFDKQFVRDYLETLSWDKTPPAPELPPDIVEKTVEKYRLALNIITG